MTHDVTGAYTDAIQYADDLGVLETIVEQATQSEFLRRRTTTGGDLGGIGDLYGVRQCMKQGVLDSDCILHTLRVCAGDMNTVT